MAPKHAVAGTCSRRAMLAGVFVRLSLGRGRTSRRGTATVYVMANKRATNSSWIFRCAFGVSLSKACLAAGLGLRGRQRSPDLDSVGGNMPSFALVAYA